MEACTCPPRGWTTDCPEHGPALKAALLAQQERASEREEEDNRAGWDDWRDPAEMEI